MLAIVAKHHPDTEVDDQAGNSWSTDGDLWLVENQALFDRLDWMPDCDAATLAYTAAS